MLEPFRHACTIHASTSVADALQYQDHVDESGARRSARWRWSRCLKTEHRLQLARCAACTPRCSAACEQLSTSEVAGGAGGSRLPGWLLAEVASGLVIFLEAPPAGPQANAELLCWHHHCHPAPPCCTLMLALGHRGSAGQDSLQEAGQQSREPIDAKRRSPHTYTPSPPQVHSHQHSLTPSLTRAHICLPSSWCCAMMAHTS